MAWPHDYDRSYVHGAIAEATGMMLRADDPLLDVLINQAQELGMKPDDLKRWIYTELPGLTVRIRHREVTDALTAWARPEPAGERERP